VRIRRGSQVRIGLRYRSGAAPPAGKRIRRFNIITIPSNELCAELHNRMPAVLKPEAWPLWLGEQPAKLAQLKALLAPYPSEDMICWPVSPALRFAAARDKAARWRGP
jgi:putative SOS response-associated peptidase YedK